MAGDQQQNREALENLVAENVAVPTSSHLDLMQDLIKDIQDITGHLHYVQHHLEQKDQMENGALLSIDKLDAQHSVLQSMLECAIRESKQTEILREEIGRLRFCIVEKDKRIEYLEALLKTHHIQKDEVTQKDASSNKVLLNDLADKPQKELKQQLIAYMDDNARLKHAIDAQLKYHMDFEHQYKNLQQSQKAQERENKNLKKELCDQKAINAELQRKIEESHIEGEFLRSEVFALKEKEAGLVGAQHALKDQISRMEKELYAAQNVIKDQQTTIKSLGLTQDQVYTRLKDSADKTQQRYSDLEQKYDKLRKDYHKEVAVREQYERVLSSFRKWKDAQLMADENTRITLKKKDDEIRALRVEKHNFMEQFNSLHNDCLTLQNELDRIRTNFFSQHGSKHAHDHSFSEEIKKRLEKLRKLSIRLSDIGRSFFASPRELNA